MAFIVKNVLGKPTGKVGDIVFRYVNRKVIFYAHIGSNKISNSEACVNNRANFSSVLRFASTVNRIPELKQIWSNSEFSGENAYRKIISANLKLIAPQFVSPNNFIVPDGFSINTEDWSLSKNSLAVTFTLPKESRKYSGKTFTAIFILAFSNPVSKESKPNSFYACTVNIVSPQIDEPFKVSADISVVGKGVIKSYRKIVAFFTIVEQGKVKPAYAKSCAHDFSTAG